MNVRWLAGWYASRLHAVPEEKITGDITPARAVCGALVYSKTRTEWAQKKLDKGVPHCKLCEKRLTPNAGVTGAA